MILLLAVVLFSIRILFSLAEVWYEREWPRATWRGLLVSIGLLFLCASAFGQYARVDIPLLTQGPNVPVTGGPLPQALWVANATVTVCTHPSLTYGACLASPVTTTNDATGVTPCPTNAQLTQLGTATPTTCSASAGTAGNVGFWYAGGIVDYWVISSYGTYGPFSINPPSPAGTFTTLTANVNRVIDVLAPPYNAKCDGTTLDDTAFQAACTAVQVSGGTMEIPPSKCKLSQKVCTISSPNVTIRGSGQQSTTLDLTGVAAIPSVFDIEGTSNVDIGNLTIHSDTGASTGTALAIKVRNSSHIKLHDLALVNSGYGVTGTNPRAAIYTENDYDVDERNISLSGSGGPYELVNGYNGHLTVGLHQSNIQDENNLTVISLSNFDCQSCTVDGGTSINQNNQTDSLTSDGYGILFYATNTTYALTSGCTGSGTLTCTIPLSGGLTQLPVAPLFTLKIAGVTGGTGTINGTWDATLLSPTTFSFVSAGANAAGANFSAGTVFLSSAYNLVSDVHVKNTAGAAIYWQGCIHCTATHWDVENTCQQEGSSTLPCGCIAINAGGTSAVDNIALGDVVGPGTCNISAQHGIDFANTQDLSIGGGIALSNIAKVGLRDFSAILNSNFDIGGNITINGVTDCWATTGTGTPHNGSVGPLTCSNFTTAGLFPGLGGVKFHNITLNGPTGSYLPGIDEFQTGDIFSDVTVNSASVLAGGSNTVWNNLIINNTPAFGAQTALSIFGAQHQVFNSPIINNVGNGIGFANHGALQPTDVVFKGARLNGVNTAAAIFDAAPGAVTITTNTSTTVTVSTNGTLIAPGMILGDYGTSGNNDLPMGDLISACTPLSGGTCVCPCSLTMAQAAIGSHAGEAGLLQATVSSKVAFWNTDIQGAFPTANQALLIRGIQGLDLENLSIAGFGTLETISLRDQTNGVTINGGTDTLASSAADVLMPGGILGSASNVNVSNHFVAGTGTNSYYDHGTGTGNVFNTFSGSLGGLAISLTNTTTKIQGTVSASITPGATAANACVEQTFNNFSGLQTGQSVSVSAPSALTHVGVSGVRVSAASTLAIMFCGDSTGGTAPAGTWIATAK